MKFRSSLSILTAMAGLAALCPATLAEDPQAAQASANIEAVSGIVEAITIHAVAPAEPIEDLGFGNRGDVCTGTACQGDVMMPVGTAIAPSDLVFITTGGQQQTQRRADSFSVTEDGDITQLCIVATYASAAGGVTATPAGASWRVSYFDDAGGFPCVTPRAQFTIPRVNPPVDVSVSIDASVGGTLFNRYTFTHPAVPVVDGECVWVEVVDTNNLTTPFFFVHLGPGLTNGDGSHAGIGVVGANAVTAYSTTSILTPNDMSFCVNVGTTLDTTTNCPGVGINPPFNDEVTSPEVLTIGGAPVPGTTVNAQQDTTVRPCGFTQGETGGVWYRVTGNGNTLTVNVDDAGCGDPAVIVYDATQFDDIGGGTAASLLCVGDDDDSGPGVGSTLSWCSGLGTEYLIFVVPANRTATGYVFARGPFAISVADGDACGMPDGENCDVVQDVGDVLEAEFCGATSNGACTGAATNPAEPYTIGTTVFGSFQTVFATSRDLDSYGFQIPTGSNVELTLTVNSSAPMIVQFQTCAGGVGTVYDGQTLFIPACAETNTFNIVFVPNFYSLVVLPVSFGGLEDCFAPFNSYRISLTAAATGACCTNTGCAINSQVSCEDLNGLYIGDGAACDPDPCAPACDLTIAGTDTAESEPCLGGSLSQTVASPNGTCATAQALDTEGDVIFGNLSSDVEGAPNGVNIRDVDLYSFTLADETDVTVTLNGETDTQFAIVSCPDGTFFSDVFDAADCADTSETFTLPAGSFTVFVTSAGFSGLSCTSGRNDYRLTVDFGGGACPGDYDGNNSVDLADLIAFNTDWQPNIGLTVPPGSAGDFDGNGVVDLADLIAFNTDWQPNIGVPCP